MPEMFSQPTRQSPLAIVFILGQVFKALFRQVWLLVLIYFLNPKKNKGFDSFTYIFLGLAAFGAISSVVNYFFHYFYVKDGELVMTKGVLRKSRLNIPLERIQSVNFSQSILHQLFDVVSMEIDSAGASGKEFALHAIPKAQAEALRAMVEDSRQVAAPAPAEGEPNAQSPNPQSPNPQSLLLFRLGFGDLLKIGISQNHLRTTGIIMAFFIGFADDLGEALDFKFSERMAQFIRSNEEGLDYLWYALLVLPVFLMLSFVGTLISTVLRYYDLQFWRSERGFKLVSGLFTRHEVSANLSKVQFISWVTTPLKRRFGMAAVRIPQAASVEVSRRLSVNLPGCYLPGLEAIREAYFPQEKSLPSDSHGVEKAIIQRMFLLQGVLPVIVLLVANYQFNKTFGWWWLLWLLPAAWLSIEHHRRWRWHINAEGLLAQWGVITQHNVLLQWYKVEAVRLRQSWFQQRAGIATLVLFTAAGHISIPFLPIAKARALLNFVLYKVETDRRKWM